MLGRVLGENVPVQNYPEGNVIQKPNADLEGVAGSGPCHSSTRVLLSAALRYNASSCHLKLWIETVVQCQSTDSQA